MAIFDVAPGAYEVQEVVDIAGWQADTETVQTVNVVTGDTSTVTFTDKELPGLRIVKHDRGNYEVMAGVTSEIWRDEVSLGKYKTDAMGEILANLAPTGLWRWIPAATATFWIQRPRRWN